MRRFGNYEILHELSTGGMGEVLLGRRRGPGAFEQLVAIKTIREQFAGTEAVRAMFLDEAAILARLGHPAIATVHDFGEEAGTLYLVMEYVAGVSLRSMIGQLPPSVAARAIAEAARGVHAAHELRDLSGQPLGLVHRDLSPDNILLGFDGHVKVIDFGIALIKNRQAPVTELGTVKGKPPYMSPEQVKNEAMDRRSDVFSLGVVLHELLTGAPLFEGDSLYAVARAVELQPIQPPSRVLGHELPRGLDDAVMQALERDPARRTPSAAAFAERLDAAAAGETLGAWTERELGHVREGHRAWIAEVVAGRDAPRPIGRSTHTRTAIGSGQLAEPASADELVPPRRRMWPIVVLALAVLGGGIAMIATMTRSAPARRATDAAAADVASVDSASPDAAIDATLAIDAAMRDAAVRVDAGRVKVAARDAGITEPVRTPPPPIADAAVAPRPPTGTITLTARHKPGGAYLNVIVDGKLLGATPMFGKRLAAGSHTFELVEPDTGTVVHRETRTLADGETISIAP